MKSTEVRSYVVVIRERTKGNATLSLREYVGPKVTYLRHRSDRNLDHASLKRLLSRVALIFHESSNKIMQHILVKIKYDSTLSIVL